MDSIGPFKVEHFITTDGYNFILPNDEWVAFRASGTEPLMRCYVEAHSAAHLKQLRSECQKLLTEIPWFSRDMPRRAWVKVAGFGSVPN